MHVTANQELQRFASPDALRLSPEGGFGTRFLPPVVFYVRWFPLVSGCLLLDEAVGAKETSSLSKSQDVS